MALITTQEVKTILGIDDSYDVRLDALIPLVSNQVMYSICQNRFINQKITMISSTLTFNEDAGTIVDSEAQFIESDFYTGKQDFVLGGSLYNDGLHEAMSVSITTLTLDLSTMSKGFKDEAAGEYIEIKQVVFPQELKLTVARWLWYLINAKDGASGKQSESVLSYSVSFLNNVPKDIMKEFNAYRKTKFS
ncbi:MAG: hypothetical protein KAJ10_12810 [Thermodesulfovibrionia bacterium]|nr:hypothetical protein [Thermodesulfovibrionia bacterium]